MTMKKSDLQASRRRQFGVYAEDHTLVFPSLADGARRNREPFAQATTRFRRTGTQGLQGFEVVIPREPLVCSHNGIVPRALSTSIGHLDLTKSNERLRVRTEELSRLAADLSASQSQLVSFPQRPLLRQVCDECI
jgi:hypothetical protein